MNEPTPFEVFQERQLVFMKACIEENLPVTAGKIAKDLVFNVMCEFPKFAKEYKANKYVR